MVHVGEFLLDETAGALLKDSIPTTHPIETKVNSPEEVEQIFDDISYGKGASILRMIESYIGKDEFRRGFPSTCRSSVTETPRKRPMEQLGGGFW